MAERRGGESGNRLKRIVKRIPLLAAVGKRIHSYTMSFWFGSSSEYWERRYRRGGTSGAGSYGRLASFKAEVLNDFVAKNGIRSVVEFGCGDGAQLLLATYPNYLGIDISPAAIELCRQRFARDMTKRFALASDHDRSVHDMALSLDVIFHLVEDEIFHRYMEELFSSAERFVVIYSSDNHQEPTEPHVKHREFSRWIETNQPDWRLHARIRNRYPFDPRDSDQTSFSDFYVYTRPFEGSAS